MPCFAHFVGNCLLTNDIFRPVTRILCEGGGANEAKVDQTMKMYFLLSDPFI